MKRTSFIKKLLTIAGLAITSPIVVPSIMKSIDGKDWAQVNVDPDDWVDVDYEKGEFSSINKSGDLMKSSDGIEWKNMVVKDGRATAFNKDGTIFSDTDDLPINWTKS